MYVAATAGVTDVVVGFPWLPGDPDRDRSAAWVLGRWLDNYPGVHLRTTDGLVADGASWCRADHVSHIVGASTGPVIVISDVDVWVEPDAVRAAVDAVRSGSVAWAVPHGDVHRLTASGSARLMAAGPDGWVPGNGEHDQPPYPGYLAGGMYVISREVAVDVPMDPRFRGWGQEDESYALALTVLVGAPWRGSAPLYHLWHPPMPRRNRRQGSEASVALCRRYKAASGDAAAMRRLVDEGRRQAA
jgi:hypothetical protein